MNELAELEIIWGRSKNLHRALTDGLMNERIEGVSKQTC